MLDRRRALKTGLATLGSLAVAAPLGTLAQGKGKDGSDQVGINLRCCDGIDVNKLSPKQVDGRSL